MVKEKQRFLNAPTNFAVEKSRLMKMKVGVFATKKTFIGVATCKNIPGIVILLMTIDVNRLWSALNDFGLSAQLMSGWVLLAGDCCGVTDFLDF